MNKNTFKINFITINHFENVQNWRGAIKSDTTARIVRV